MSRTLFRNATLRTMAPDSGVATFPGDLLVEGATIAGLAAHIAAAPDMRRTLRGGARMRNESFAGKTPIRH